MKGVQVMSIHIAAKIGDIAETVLLPGDPKRAKWIAENYLENSFCYTDIRGMLGFTGTYKGKRISVQGTGMGIPSISIYITELMKDYGVKNLIRIGSAGSYQKDIKVRDVVIAMSTSTDSNINNRRFYGGDFSPTANFELFSLALKVAEELAEAYRKGNKSLIAGNGGSNCDAMHFAEEFTGRFRKDRKALPSLSISKLLL